MSLKLMELSKRMNDPMLVYHLQFLKKKGNYRLLIIELLNKITKRIEYPLPLIDDIIDALGAQYFISRDFKSFFYQMPLHPDSVKFTSFKKSDRL